MFLASTLRSLPRPEGKKVLRQHERLTLRLLAIALSIASLILNTVATRTFYYHPAHFLTSCAYLPLSLSLLWHLLDLHATRSGRPLRPRVLCVVEGALAVAFVALFVVGAVMIRRPHFWYGLDTVGRTVLMTWDAALWLVLGIVHTVVVVQCGLRLWRRKRRRCSECMREKRRARDEVEKGVKEEQGLLKDDCHREDRGIA